jgi:hypothetical protein
LSPKHPHAPDCAFCKISGLILRNAPGVMLHSHARDFPAFALVLVQLGL